MRERSYCATCGEVTLHVGLVSPDNCVRCQSEEINKKYIAPANLIVFDRLFKDALFGHNRNQL